MNWVLLTVLLCTFGFIKEMRPSEAFLTLYLTEWKNLTIEQISNEIYPWWTYAYLIWLVPVFLLTDYLRYKPVLVVEGAAAIGTWALVPVEWSKRAELFMSMVCAGNAAFLIVMAHTTSIWIAYAMYVLFRTSYVTVVTIATAQIAQNLEKQRYGLVFGCNMFASLVLESVLTVIVVDKAGLGVGVVEQFTVYGGYFGVISMLFFTATLVRCRKQNKYVDVRMSDD